MFHNRTGPAMSAGAHTSQRSDLELQGVGPFADLHSPPPQTRPFTGVLDQHHCLLPQPQPRPPCPPHSHSPPRSAPAAVNAHKRSSSSAHPSEHDPQDHQRRHSSSSQKMRSGGPAPPAPHGRADMTEARREQRNGAPAPAGDDHHVSRDSRARPPRAADLPAPTTKERDLPAAGHPAPRNGGAAGGVQTQPSVTVNPVIEDASRSSDQVIDWGDANSANNDKIDGLLQKARNNYERLRADQSASQHLYRPIVEQYEVRPSKAAVSAPESSTPSKPSQGAKSPLYESTDVCTLQVRPQSSPFLPSKRNQRPDQSDDIIELQSDIKTGKSREEKQNNSNARKEVPEVTEVPNTNFAIACMVALCFNLPFGVVAMYFSLRAVRAFQEGRAKLGERRSRWSIVLSLLGITITTVIISSVVLYTAMQGQKRISRHKAYGTRTGLNL